MTGDKWSTVNRRQPASNRAGATFVARCPLLVVLLVSAVTLALGACGATSSAEQTGEVVAGINTPEAAVYSFFKDLGAALQDPALAQDETQARWVERLAEYFAPNERDNQRDVLRLALTSFSEGIGELAPEESLTIELRFDTVEKLTDDGQRATVRLNKASIYVLIVRSTDRGEYVLYEDEIGLHEIIGRDDGAVPTIKIGDRWFLTEG